jgi:hypothetical protein
MITQYEKAAEAAKLQRFTLRATVAQGVEIIDDSEAQNMEVLHFCDFVLYIVTLQNDYAIHTSATAEQLRIIAAQYVVRDTTTRKHAQTLDRAINRQAAKNRAVQNIMDARGALENYYRLDGNFKSITLSGDLMQLLQEIQKWED